ncbi:MAG: GC-type dockerin domain-anchored protein [Planctomycetota bacterium]
MKNVATAGVVAALVNLAGTASGQMLDGVNAWTHHTSPDGDPVIQTIVTEVTADTFVIGPDPDNTQVPFARLADRLVDGNAATSPEGDAPSDVVFSPDGSLLLLTHRESNTLDIYDAVTFEPVSSFPIPGQPQTVAVTPDGTRAVVGLIGADEAAVVNLSTGAIERSLFIGDGIADVKVLPADPGSGEPEIAVVYAALFDVATPEGAFVSFETQTGTQTAVSPIEVGGTQQLSFGIESQLQDWQYNSMTVLDNDRVVTVDPFADPPKLQFFNARTGAYNAVDIRGALGAGETATRPSRDAALSADGSTVAVSYTTRVNNVNFMNVALFDAATETLTRTVTVELPSGYNTTSNNFIGLNFNATRAVVALSNSATVVNLFSETVGPLLSTASVNGINSTPDGQRAVLTGRFGSVVNYFTGTIVSNVNNEVSPALGAVSPSTNVAAQVSTTFGNNLVIMEVDGSPRQLNVQRSGPGVESDRLRVLDVSADGSRIVGAYNSSFNAALIDAATGNVVGNIPAGERVFYPTISPDGSTAVVPNGDESFVTIADLDNLGQPGSVTNVNISRRGFRTAISPDGQYAYIAVIASGDGVWRVNLQTRQVEGPKLTTGNMTSYTGFFQTTSEIKLSPDGSLLVTADGADDQLTFIDTAAWQVIGTVSIPKFSNDTLGVEPGFLSFSEDGSLLAVTNVFDDAIAIVDVATRTVINNFEVPFFDINDNGVQDNNEDPFPIYNAFYGNDRLFVADLSSEGAPIRVFDPLTGVQEFTISFGLPDGTGVKDLAVDQASGRLYTFAAAGSVTLSGVTGIQAQGNSFIFEIDAETLELISSVTVPQADFFDLDIADGGGLVAVSAPFGDGVVIAESDAAAPCPPDQNQDGVLDIDDFSQFVLNFFAGNLLADVNDDDMLDIDDFSSFVSQFFNPPAACGE